MLKWQFISCCGDTPLSPVFEKVNPQKATVVYVCFNVSTCPKTSTSFSTKSILISFREPCLSPLSVPEVRNSHVTQTWPTGDWFRDGFMSKAGPMWTCPGTVAGTIEKDMLGAAAWKWCPYKGKQVGGKFSNVDVSIKWNFPHLSITNLEALVSRGRHWFKSWSNPIVSISPLGTHSVSQMALPFSCLTNKDDGVWLTVTYTHHYGWPDWSMLKYAWGSW